MPRVVHFEIHAPDPQAAIRFYETNFGWTFSKWDGPIEYWLIDTGLASQPGINGGLMKSRDGQPRTVNTLEVADLDAAAAKAARSGGQVVVPKMAIPGVGWVAYCTDPGGNIFGIFKQDHTAR